jgi:hypothetical protein
MENLSSSSFSFLTSEMEDIESRIKQSLDRRSSGPEYSAVQFDTTKDYRGSLFGKKYYDILCLLTLITYQPDYFEEFGSYLIYEIQEYLEKNLLFPELNALAIVTQSKLIFLYIVLNYSKCRKLSNFYSAVLTDERINSVLSKIRFQYESHRKARRLIRHKGYRDHGTLRPETRWTETKDFSFDEEQNEIERQRQIYQDTIRSILTDSGDRYLKFRLR